jgi:hypothetical protein
LAVALSPSSARALLSPKAICAFSIRIATRRIGLAGAPDVSGQRGLEFGDAEAAGTAASAGTHVAAGRSRDSTDDLTIVGQDIDMTATMDTATIEAGGEGWRAAVWR